MMMCSFFSGSRSLFKRVKVMEGVEYLCRASFLLGNFAQGIPLKALEKVEQCRVVILSI